MENIFYVYLHRRKTDNKVFYVGKGKGYRATDRSNRSQWWKRVAEKHEVTVEIVFDNLSEEDAFQIEKDTILEFRYFGHPLVNHTNGGEGTSGHKQTAETIQKRVAKTTGKKRTAEQRKRLSNSRIGKKFSPSHCLAISKAQGNRKDSPEVVAKRAASNTGKKRTEEQKARMKAASKAQAERNNLSEKNKGLNNPSADKSIYRFFHTETKEEFVGTRVDFSTFSGITCLALNRIFGKKPHAKTCYGWKVIKDNNDTKTEEKTEEH